MSVVKLNKALEVKSTCQSETYSSLIILRCTRRELLLSDSLI